MGSSVYEKLLRSGVGKSPCGLVVKPWLCYFLTVNLGKLLVLSELNFFCEMVTIIVKIIIVIIRPAFKVVVRVR